MSIFGKIMGAIFGTKADAAPASTGAAAGAGSSSAGSPSAAPASGGAAPSAGSSVGSPSAAPAGGGAAASAGSSGGSPSAAPAAAPAQSVDVAAILDKAVAAKREKLAWRTSIVDLMKALDIDSSFAARKELAKELGYTGDSNDSATMNIWLHKQVMTKLAANGGKLPPEIKH